MGCMYTFARARTIEGHQSTRSVATDAINALISVIGDRLGWTYTELTQIGDPRPRIRVDYPVGALQEEFRVAFGRALFDRGVNIVFDFLTRPGYIPLRVTKDLQLSAVSPIVGSVVTLRLHEDADICVHAELGIGVGFWGTIRAFERFQLEVYKDLRVGDHVEFLEEHVFGVVG